ncbi:Serine/threonine protein kinase [Oceanospirillum multiglobuliferum]|uniref:Serine/threonine protein kinase n=1 Tax=Oceanospirillum multiglobuliferum TaxID=64969 RepID=A0A1T4KVD0_9GAMM|nr:bifunctional serine/threonine-protein phosphatase/kinase [Oceanospirillum multiglobuliferum]OPX54965.1 serine/threonine protein kinase [Oceanospirillum multiglobuliferum]SJZ46394.1 Serine/threonine protein kinase [Oceanospirillum multiglobuliferum]
MTNDSQLKISYGQAFIAPDKNSVRSTMSVKIPEGSALAAKGIAAVVADSTWRNVIAKQAAETCTRGFLADYYATPDNWDVKTSATKVLSALNSWLFSQGKNVANGNYISSFSAVVLKGRQGHLFHMGDTLVFRLRGGEFEQVSREHTNFMGGYRYPSRALGLDPSVDIDYHQFNLKQGDIFLFTTQAAKGTLVASDYVQLIRQYAADLNQACDQILHTACEKASARGYSSTHFCFQLARVDLLPDEQGESIADAFGALPVPNDMNVGEELDGYRIEEVLNKSAMSCIYRVRDKHTGRQMVLKAPAPQLAMRKDFIRQFIMQQWVVERVNSPYVAKIVDASRPRNSLYYLREYVDGRTLTEWIAQNPNTDLRRMIDLIEQMVKAIRALHRRDILCQGLHPDNILVDQMGMIKLIDFASCAVPGAVDLPSPLVIAKMVGFSSYTAPEYRLSREPNANADQFSLAAIAYWMLTGQKVYVDQMDSLHSRADISRLEYMPSFQYNPMIPVWLDGALRRALQPNPELRYRRLSEFIYDLKKPNPHYIKETQMPLAERSPLVFWKGLSGVLLLLLLLSLMH